MGNGIFDSSVAGTPAVSATGTNGADGIFATSDSIAIEAVGGSVGISCSSASGIGVSTHSGSGSAIEGSSSLGTAIMGTSNNSVGVYGNGGTIGVQGISNIGTGVVAHSSSGFGIDSVSSDSYGISGKGGDIGVYAQNLTNKGNAIYLGTKGLAGDFYGEVCFHNNITKQGGGFQIDHPLAPANKYLSHSFVESPDMKNIYDGTVVLDANGEAEVELPVWFEALNTDFRYQLTCIGHFTPVYIAQEMQCNRFKIAGGTPGMKISWQVTGNRQDAWANAHRVQVEIEKSTEEQGYYLAPELYGESAEKSIQWVRYSKQE